jgi:hypothetical protein
LPSLYLAATRNATGVFSTNLFGKGGKLTSVLLFEMEPCSYVVIDESNFGGITNDRNTFARRSISTRYDKTGTQ